MYLKYGNYSHDAADAAVSIVRTPLLTDAGVQYGVEELWSIRGMLQAASQSALNTAISALLTAYSINYQNVGLYLDDGTQTAHYMPGVTAIGGVTVVGGPSFEEGRGAEFSTYRSYTIQLKGQYRITSDPGFVGQLITWAETLAFVGGGPRFVYLQPIEGLPQRQIVAESTPYFVTQTGQASCLLTWPQPAPPIWPAAEHRDRRRITPEAPQRSGGAAAKFSEFKISWSYEFESATPLSGQPTYWR